MSAAQFHYLSILHFPGVGKLILIIGVCIGLNAAIVSIVSEWLGDIKMGYCSDGWWLNQQFCCWEIEGEEVDGCDAWHSWSHVTLARWMVFVLFAVSEDPFPWAVMCCADSFLFYFIPSTDNS